MTSPDYFRAFILHFGVVYYVHTRQVFVVAKGASFASDSRVTISGNQLQIISVGIAVFAIVFCSEDALS